MPNRTSYNDTKCNLTLAKGESANSTDSPQNSYVDRFINHMRKIGITPANDIIPDGKFHHFHAEEKDSSGSDWWGYILNTDKPVMGLAGSLNSGKPKKWAVKYKNKQNMAISSEKEESMRIEFKRALAAAQAISEDKTLDPVDQLEASQANEIVSEVDDTVVARLSALSAFDYDRVRKEEAIRLNIRVSTLDKAVQKERKTVSSVKSVGPQLLSAIHDIFSDKNVDQISTKELISALCADLDKIWAVYNQGDQIASKQLAYILKLYGIHSRDIRFSNGVAKGYTRESISAAFSRIVAVL